MIDIHHQGFGEGDSIREAYDELYQERSLLMRDSSYLWLLELIDAKAGATLVDVACGNGRLVLLAAAQGIHAIGVDLSFQALSRVAFRSPARATWVVADGETIALPDTCADAVVSIGSLEHYDDPQQGAAELARILKPGGRACILLPNAFGLFGNFQSVWRSGEVWDDGQPHQRYATRRTWQAMLLRGGLVAESVVGWGEISRPRTTLDFDWLAVQPQKWVRAALAAMLPANVANQLIYICRRATAEESRSVRSHYLTLPHVEPRRR